MLAPCDLLRYRNAEKLAVSAPKEQKRLRAALSRAEEALKDAGRQQQQQAERRAAQAGEKSRQLVEREGEALEARWVHFQEARFLENYFIL